MATTSSSAAQLKPVNTEVVVGSGCRSMRLGNQTNADGVAGNHGVEIDIEVVPVLVLVVVRNSALDCRGSARWWVPSPVTAPPKTYGQT